MASEKGLLTRSVRWLLLLHILVLLFNYVSSSGYPGDFTCSSSTDMESEKLGLENPLEEAKHLPVCECGFKMLDSSFLSKKKMLEIQKGANDFNRPIIRSNRKLVATTDGGLHNPSCLVFNSAWKVQQIENEPNKKINYPSPVGIQRPKSDEDIAFQSILELGQLLKENLITSVELTGIFLKRLKRYGPVLESVNVITEELAYKQAKEADQLLAEGKYLGPLHGIPNGLKEIIAVPNYTTTWGSTSFKDQVLDIEAWAYKRLKSAGAVLVAKLVTGSLAYADIWFGGRTRNPWNIEEYSTGSSAGSASCTSAGLVPFAIGSETAGSITFPASRCGVTALRPTFGAVGRTGPRVDITKLTVGYLEDADMEVVHVLQSKGANMVPFNLSYTVDSFQGILNFTMDVEMLAHFDKWQRSNLDDEFEDQDKWPIRLRRARAISAVDYFQAQRARGMLIQQVRESFKVDAFIGNATEWEKVCLGNLVGIPVVVVPTGFKKISDAPSNDTRRRKTVTTGIYAPPDHDHVALALAMAYQSVTDHHKQRPPIDDLGPNDSIPDSPKSL
ncbi:putative calnexin -like protein [Capsicum annuum]|nr:putative calnexin -like protein [Capsicum annuum]